MQQLDSGLGKNLRQDRAQEEESDQSKGPLPSSVVQGGPMGMTSTLSNPWLTNYTTIGQQQPTFLQQAQWPNVQHQPFYPAPVRMQMGAGSNQQVQWQQVQPHLPQSTPTHMGMDDVTYQWYQHLVPQTISETDFGTLCNLRQLINQTYGQQPQAQRVHVDTSGLIGLQPLLGELAQQALAVAVKNKGGTYEDACDRYNACFDVHRIRDSCYVHDGPATRRSVGNAPNPWWKRVDGRVSRSLGGACASAAQSD